MPKEETSRHPRHPPPLSDTVVNWLLTDLFLFFVFSFDLLFLQALAWVSDLMIEHQEIFWSLFTVDMDATLIAQPPDTWQSFQLFQLLNEYLSNDRKCLKLSC